MDKLKAHLETLKIIPFGSDSFVPASPNQLLALESNIGIALPEEYRWLMLNYGSFRFGNVVEVCGTDGRLYPFGFFLDIREVSDYIDSPPDQFPPNCLALEEDGLGDMYCLGLKGRIAGKVFYWYHDIGWGDEAEKYIIKGLPVPEGVDTPCLHLVADSMAQFIQQLQIKRAERGHS